MSAAPRRGLGRGLDALLGGGTNDVTSAPPPAPVRDALPQIPLERIVPNPHQPRTSFAPEALAELRDSIAAFGVLVPIIVRERAGGYELVAGERRWRAAAMAGLAAIPAIVRNADDRDSLEIAIIENLQRENLDPLEEAMGFAHLMEAYALTQEQVAERMGRSRPAIANALRLLSLSDSVKGYVRDGRLTARHARAILAFPPERRETMAKRAVDEDLTVRDLERLAADAAPRRARTAPPSADDEAWLQRLRYRYATQVGIVRGAAGGTIELRYADSDDLVRIVDLLLGDSA